MSCRAQSIAALAAGLVLLLTQSALGQAGPLRSKFSLPDGTYLIIEVLDDDLMHFEYSAIGAGPATSTPLPTSVMIDKHDYAGPSRRASSVQTRELRATVAPTTLCVSVRDLIRAVDLTTVCPKNLKQDWKSLTLTRGAAQNAYGLGQQFKTLGSADGDWVGKVREARPGFQSQEHGNGFMPFGPAGLVGNVQFPVLYAVGANYNYALFLDNVYKQEWDLRTDPWTVSMWGDQIRFYVMSGPNLPDLRADYLELVGRPPVPPRKAFGLWVSEFGYKNFGRIDELKNSLRADGFPLDGFVLDLFWFGGIKQNDPNSPMGRLDWDVSCNDGNDYCFPNPASKLQEYANDHLGFVAIEESYVARNSPTFAAISGAGRTPFAFARDSGHHCSAASYTPISLSEWFGDAAMLDWSDPAVGPWVHENKRFPNLVQAGVLGHWTDLGEPEKYDPNACYDGVVADNPQHGDIHNLYNLLWNRSIYEGYRAKSAQVNRRPFIVTRSGAPGTQRYGAAMWSGDIGSNLDILATHLNAQMHMSFSGIDYYGADIGGFRREGLPYNGNHEHREYEQELFTQWFANGAWFDVPVRPHTDNAFQAAASYQTAPNKIGVKATNLANLRQRYELIPYYYSLAYRAHLSGEPLIAPLPFYYQSDPNVRSMGHEKLIGRDILVAVVARHGEYQRDVYLPAGDWVNYQSNEWVTSSGQWLRDVPVYRDGVLRLPVFVRAGAILPQMRVGPKTLDAFDNQSGGGADKDLIVRVYPAAAASSFTLYEDDGSTLGFDANGKPSYVTRTTELSQRKTANQITVTIGPASGTYPGAAASRNNEARILLRDLAVTQLRIDGQPATEAPDAAAYATASGRVWRAVTPNIVYAKSGDKSVTSSTTFELTTTARAPRTSVHFVCDNGWTQPGEHVAVVGSIPELGAWDTSRAIKLQPNVYYDYITHAPGTGPGPQTPKWTGVVSGLPPATAIEWKCVVRAANGSVLRWSRDPNQHITTGASGFSGSGLSAF